MDASASVKADAEYNKLFSVYVKIQNPFVATSKHRSSVVKYTRLSELDLKPKGPWTENKYSLEPRLRRIIAIEEPNVETTRSLKSNVALSPKMSTTGYSKRKIVTIEEDEEKSLHPKFSRDVKTSYSKMINRAVETGMKDQKLTHRTTSRLSNATKYSPDTKQNTKTNSLGARKEMSVPNFRSKQTKENDPYLKESHRYVRNTNATSKINQSKRVNATDSERAIQTVKNKLKEETKEVIKRVAPNDKYSKTSQEQNRVKSLMVKEISERKKPITVIHVPLEEDLTKQDLINQLLADEYIEKVYEKNVADCIKELDKINTFKDVNVGTEPIKTLDQITETVCDYTQNSHSISEEIRDKTTFDSLEIPNVTLIKDKEPKENIVNFNSQSIPNLKAPAFTVTPDVKEKIQNEQCFRKSTSYIISTATLTYTTKQKINFHVVENEIDMNLPACPVSYPINVISVYKKEMKDKQARENTPNRQEERDANKQQRSDTQRLRNKSHVCPKTYDRHQLMKPSDIISSIKAQNSLVPNDYINEQFQRELNFIDSFLESLQYLENCSLTENTITQSSVDDLVNNTYDLKKLEYDSFFSKFDSSQNVDDRETMASKSLCLLNLLIRDEQRRAKNLLFVLKMREDALKDFTKSQILWLENRKKQDNTDISTLKKKQRGALLKLQHECGEMQRMRKALLTLSEKRKVALMKTKRNIELKFKNPVDVEQIILEKRKLKRSTSTDRNTAPLKCFDLSSSGCEESTTSRPKSLTPVCILKPAIESSGSAEKCIQTGDSILAPTTVNQSTSTADENFVVVDGGYLNILFQNLTLPEIFSSGKQYEVNEEALKNIVATTNSQHVNIKEGDVIKKFMDQVKSQDADRSSSPSTARSLVEELDLYYKGLSEKEKSPISSPEVGVITCEVKDVGVQMCDESNWQEEASKSVIEEVSVNKSSLESVEVACVCEPLSTTAETQCVKGRDEPSGSVAGPLPVPAGAAAVVESTPPDQVTWNQQKLSSSSTSPECLFAGEGSSIGSPVLYPSVSSLVSPAQSEAEELRRQQLAIEREIKALEQQQCQLLVVREIPDKPPPPYTPPSETRAPRPRKFCVDSTIEERIHKYITKSIPPELEDADSFDAFLKDYCQESLSRQKKERGDKFWDNCHDLPPKPQLDAGKLAIKTSADLKEVLTGVTPTIVSGVGARRSDHIDDILFAEWRRCEPEWTSLHTDEVIVKNQLFESIFQKILTETIDEYKKTVLANKNPLQVNVTL
ncbi:uncharacterized protein LOC123704922 isoform X2 [Colias croceus]|uniref:uncharacterized protein LOC123704922 isoform X2 n=1 Tax=Colias crocea TaxID=72248 RepID=UPI001E279D9C|nr:uncharacterized protein LOC123704922 isoform X2 [Colias croceus]